MGGEVRLWSYGILWLVLWYLVMSQLSSERFCVCICVSLCTCLGVSDSLDLSVPGACTYVYMCL